MPQFKTMEEAELFANEMRIAANHCVISEPYPVWLTESIEPKLLEI